MNRLLLVGTRLLPFTFLLIVGSAVVMLASFRPEPKSGQEMRFTYKVIVAGGSVHLTTINKSGVKRAREFTPSEFASMCGDDFSIKGEGCLIAFYKIKQCRVGTAEECQENNELSGLH